MGPIRIIEVFHLSLPRGLAFLVFETGTDLKEGPCLVRACKYVCDLVNVLLRGVGRILVLLTGHRQAGLLRNGNSTRCEACGCVKRDFYCPGRATGSIALGTQDER